MIKKEWSAFCKSWWLKIVIVAIIAIPSIYAGVFLGSIWDPYGNTKDIPVAVVNEDKEVKYNESSLDVGNELANNLKKSDSMNFNLVDSKKASKGLENGDYYMVITIPEDFSKNATTLLDDSPKKMILNYTTNPGSSYIASKMNDSAITKIKDEVSSTVTKTYAKTIFNQLGTVGSGMSEAADGSKQINDGTNQLISGNELISNNLQVLATSSITFKDGANTLTNGLSSYIDGVVTVNNGVYSLKDGIGSLNNAAPALGNGINQLNTGANDLEAGINLYTNGVNTAYQGSQALTSNNDALNNGVDQLGENITKLKDGNKLISDGISDMAKQVNIANTSLLNYNNLIDTLQQKGNAQQKALAQTILNNGLSKEDVIKYGLTKYGVNEALPSSQALLKEMSESINTLNNGLNGDSGLVNGSNKIQVGLNNLNSKVNGGQYINDDGSTTNIDVDKSLKTGVKNYLAGVQEIDFGLEELNNKSKNLNDGAKKLYGGTKQLTNQVPTLTNGINALNQGATKLANGTNTLVNNNDSLLNGANKLANGANQISDGAEQLAAGSTTLGTGLTFLQDGANTLATALDDGAKQVNSINANDNTFDMLATPIDTAHQEISTVENNGHGMAPYMMSVGLYVACMAFTLMYPLFNNLESAESGFKYWLSKASVWFSVSTIASIVMIA